MKDTFCVMPFLHLNIQPDGNLKPCCISNNFDNTQIVDSSIKEAYNSEEFKKLRIDMLNGVENNVCAGCYKAEKINSVSYRETQNEKYKDYIEKYKSSVNTDGSIELDFVDLDLRPSTTCNLKCRTCSDVFSTSWIEERKAVVKKYKWFDQSVNTSKNLNLNLDEENIKNVKHIYFAGGEPMYMKEMFKFLKDIKNKNEIFLFINTNFTNLNEKLFNESFFQFKEVHFIISCDGIGKVGEYIRTNMIWKQFIKNIEFLKYTSMNIKNINYSFQFTCSVLNCFHFFKYREFMYEKNYIFEDNDLRFSYVQFPFWYNIKNFDSLRKDVIEYFEKNIDSLDKNSSLYVEILNFLNYLKSDIVLLNEDEIVNKKQYRLLKEWTDFGNEYNNTKIPKELSYIKKLIT